MGGSTPELGASTLKKMVTRYTDETRPDLTDMRNLDFHFESEEMLLPDFHHLQQRFERRSSLKGGKT
jgi:hypothetical protein